MLLIPIALLISAIPESPSIDVLSAAVTRHQAKYEGVQFDYKADFEKGRDGKFTKTPDGSVAIVEKGTKEIISRISSRDTLRLMRPPSGDRSALWRDWKQHTFQVDPPEWKMARFAVFNGRETRLYKARPHQKWNQGNMIPFEDNVTFEGNTFDCFLHLNVYGLPDLSNNVVSPSPYKWTIVDSTKAFDQMAYHLKGALDKSPYTFYVTVMAPPHALVLQATIREGKLDTSPVLEEYVTDDVGTFEGIKYPAKGRYVRQPSGIAGYRSYRFSVTGVKRFSSTTPAKWLPDFPPGTAVGDQVNGKNFAVEHEDRSPKEVR